MTIQSELIKAGPFDGNDSTTVFPFTNIKVFAAADLAVIHTTAAGVETTLVKDTDYSVSLNADQEVSPGGSVTYPISGSPLPTGEKLTILNALDYLQESDLQNGGAWNPEVVENALDRLTLLALRNAEEANRSIKAALSSDPLVDYTLPGYEAGRVLMWDFIERRLIVGDAPYTNIAVQVESVTLSEGQTAVIFTQAIYPASFYIRGALVDSGRLEEGVDYTIDRAANTVTLTESYPAGTRIVMSYGGEAGTTPVGSRQDFDTVAQLKNASLSTGLTVTTKGYYTAGDGGGAEYYVKSAGDYGGTPDGYGDHTLANGNVAVLQVDGILDANWFGIVADGAATSGTDNTNALQAFFNAAEKGQKAYIPSGIYNHTGLAITKSIDLFGDLSHHQFDDDSANALNQGTILHNTSATATNLLVQPENVADRRLQISIEDLSLVGAKWDGPGFTGITTSGHGLEIDGLNGVAETAVNFYLNNVFSAGHSEHGFYIHGDTYGSDIGYVSAFRNGKNGLRLEGSGGNPAGETTINHIRAFYSGADGITDDEKSGVYFSTLSVLDIQYISCTHFTGAAFYAKGGSYNVGTIWTEAVDGTPSASHAIIQFGDGTTGVSSATIDSINCQPGGTTYPGKCVLVKTNSGFINVRKIAVNDTIAGNHVECETGTEGCRFETFRASSATAVVDSSGQNYFDFLNSAFLARMAATQANATGDGTIVNPVLFNVDTTPGYDLNLEYDTTNSRFIAKTSGVYQFNAVVRFSGADGASHTNFQVGIYVNGTARSISDLGAGLTPTAYQGVATLQYKLAKGDYVDVRVAVSGGAKTVTVGSTSVSLSNFSGALIKPTYGY